MSILNFIWDYRYLLLWGLTALVAGITMGKQWIKEKVYTLMLLAKKLAKDQVLATGAAQEEWVVNALYILLKKLKIPFVTKESLQPLVDKLYKKAMDYLDDGKLNNSIQ